MIKRGVKLMCDSEILGKNLYYSSRRVLLKLIKYQTNKLLFKRSYIFPLLHSRHW